MDLTTDKVREVIKFSQSPMSLDTPIGEDQTGRLGDFIPDQNVPDAVDVANEHMMSDVVDDALAELSPRERRVLQLRFGLEDGRSRTLEEVGGEFSVTRERIRQIEAKALRKLRLPATSGKLRSFIE